MKFQSFNDFEPRNLISTSALTNIAIGILLLSLFRGFIPLYFEGAYETKYIYYLTSGTILIYTLRQIISSNRKILPNRFNILLSLNFIFYFGWLIVEFIAGIGIPSAMFFISLGVMPFLIIPYLSIKREVFDRILLVSAILLSFFTIIDYLMVNTQIFPDGYIVRENMRKLIISSYNPPTYSGSGNLMRAVGLTGDEHETASLLVMLGVFLLCTNGKKKQYIYYIAFVLSFVALLLTASAANIIVFILISIPILIYKFKTSRISIPIRIIITLFLLMLLGYTLVEFKDLLQFTARISDDSISTMMSRQLNVDIFNEIIALIFGHTEILGLAQFGKITEVGLFRIIYNSGILLSIATLLILLYPLFLFVKASKFTKREMMPYVMGVTAGFLTLIHYGTLLRMTNVVLFFSLYGMSIRINLLAKMFERLSYSKKILYCATLGKRISGNNKD